MVIRTPGSNLRSVDFAIDRSTLFPGQRFLLFLFLYHGLQIVRAVDMETDGPADEDVEPERENSSRQSEYESETILTACVLKKKKWSHKKENTQKVKRTSFFLFRTCIFFFFFFFWGGGGLH